MVLDWVSIIEQAKTQNKYLVPYASGNMYWNAIKIIPTAEGYDLIVDPRIADYVYYTNEKWKERTNPNEGWVWRFFEAVIQSIIAIVKSKTGDV